MKKISRRVFLLLFLSASSTLYLAAHQDLLSAPPAQPAPAQPLPDPPEPTQPLSPTLEPTQFLPTLVPRPTATRPPAAQDPYADQEATPIPINEVAYDSNPGCPTPITAPEVPAMIPPATGVDAATGRHMMGDMQVIDHHTYRLAVSGLVDHPLSLSYDDLRCMPKMTETVTTTCYAFADTATWSGVQISEVLKRAGVQPGAKKLLQTSADGVTSTVPLDMALDPHNFLAYQMGNKPLPILFGFPVRSIFINVAGQYSIKWLTALEVT